MASTKKVSCCLINIESVGNKTNKIKCLIDELRLDICVIIETWLSNNVSDSSKIKEMTPISHNFYHVPRENRWGGGVGIFTKKAFTKVQTINIENYNSFEYMDIKITSENKNVRLIIVYRPPNKSKKTFLEEISDLLDSLENKTNLVICGDFNLHLDNPNDNYVKKFIDVLEHHDLVNQVNLPTSKMNHIIDLVIHTKNKKITNNIEVEPECTISPTHKLITFEIDFKKSENTKKKIIFRNKKNFDSKQYIETCTEEITRMEKTCECGRRSQQEQQSCVSCFTAHSKKILSDRYNEKCPLIEKTIKEYERAKWFNNEVKEAKKQRRKMEDKWKRNKTTENWNNYKRTRNKYYTLVEEYKKKYYTETFRSTKKSKETHKNLNELIGLKKEKVLPDKPEEHKALANEFVNYFESKVEKICAEIAKESFVEGPNMMQVENIKLKKFKKLNMNDLDKIMGKVKLTYCENDPLPISDIKDAENYGKIKTLYLNIVNRSLEDEFPQCEKLACIKPGYKGKGEKNNLSAYRPISNLSYLSKIIETVVYEQTWSHLSSLNIIPEEQSAYRENHSTETTNCAIMNDMIEIIRNNECGILIMIDLSAAFDTVNHTYLLEDLKNVGIEEDCYRWYETYLQGREVTVIISNTKSETRKLTKGVPQGSVLGPMLFSIYTRELAMILEQHNVKYKLYADDTQFYMTVKSVQEAERKIDAIMKDIKNWMVKKKLKMNEDKTECMLFGTKKSLKKYEHFNQIKISTTTIEITKKVRDLGVYIDNELKMEDQIKNTVKICNYHIRNIAFIRKYLDRNALQTLISNHILSRLDYCNTLYYALSKSLQKKLQRVQNSAARLITRTKQRERITPALIELHWLPIKARIEYKIILLTYKALKYNEPKYLRKMLNRYDPGTNLTTRLADEIDRLHEPRTNTIYGERAFSYCAPRLFNKLPTEIRNLPNTVQFKKKLKTFLFDKCYDVEEKTMKQDYKL